MTKDRHTKNAKTDAWTAILACNDCLVALEHFHTRFQNITHLEEARDHILSLQASVTRAIKQMKKAEAEE